MSLRARLPLLALLGGALAAAETNVVEIGDATDAVTTVAFSTGGDSTLLATGSYDNEVRLYSLADAPGAAPRPRYVWGVAMSEYSKGVQSVAFSGDSSLLAVGLMNGTVLVYTLGWSRGGLMAGVLKYTLADSTDATDVAFSPDSRLLATASHDTRVRVYDLRGDVPRLVHSLQDSTQVVNALAFSANSRLLATASGDTKARVYALGGSPGQPPSLEYTLGSATQALFSVAFSADSRRLAMGSGDSEVRIHTFGSDREDMLMEATADIASLAYSPDGKFLAAGSFDKKVRIYSAGQPGLGPRETMEGATDMITSVAFTADSRLLSVGSYDHKARIYFGFGSGAAAVGGAVLV